MFSLFHGQPEGKQITNFQTVKVVEKHGLQLQCYGIFLYIYFFCQLVIDTKVVESSGTFLHINVFHLIFSFVTLHGLPDVTKCLALAN